MPLPIEAPGVQGFSGRTPHDDADTPFPGIGCDTPTGAP